jgi:hypothetical protein
VKDENGDLPADFHNILNSWKNYSELLKVHEFSGVRQIEIYTAEPLLPDRSPFEVEFDIAKLRRDKLPGRDQIPQNLFKQKVKYFGLRSISLLIIFGIRYNCLISGRSLLLYQFSIRVIKLTVVIIVGYHWYKLYTKCYPISFFQGYVHIWIKLLAIISVSSEVTNQLLITSFFFFLHSPDTGEKMGLN